MPPYPTLAIANYFIEQANAGFGSGIDPLKLQKLVYYAHGWNLAVNGRPLIDEPVEAWQYGPVIPSLYHEFKAYGRESIDLPAYEYDHVTGERVSPAISPEDTATRALLDRVWKTYGRFSGVQLSTMTHQPGSPWANTWERKNSLGLRIGADIPNEEIRRHFEQEALQNRRSESLVRT